MDSKEMAGKLNKLLERNLDAEKTFREATEEVKDERLQRLFVEKTRQHYELRHELESEIRSFGESPSDDSSVKNDVQRSWMNLKSSFSSNKEGAVLEEVSKGEKEAIKEYDTVVKEDDLPPSTLNMLIKHRKRIEESLVEVQRLENDF